MTKAIIFVDSNSDDNVEIPRSFLNVGGISLLERQLRQLNEMGVDHVYIASFHFPERLHAELNRFKCGSLKSEVVDGNFLDTNFWDGLGDVLLIEEGVLLDERIFTFICKAEVDDDATGMVSVFPVDQVVYGAGNGTHVSWGDTEYLFASVAKLDGLILKAASLESDFKEAPVAAILKMAHKAEAKIFSIDDIDTYDISRRRNVPVLWRPVSAKKECNRGTQVLVDAEQKGTADWPTRYIHPFFENVLIFYACKTFITPTMLMILTGGVGLYITYLFAIGHMGMALGGAMVYGVLKGLEGKVARVKKMVTKSGDLEHILDKIVEYFWYLAMAYYFAHASGTTGPWAIGGLIILFSWANVVQEKIYLRFTGRHLDDAGGFERVFRLIGANRNTLIWTMLPFALTQKWEQGFWLMAIYTVITFFVSQWRFIHRLKDYLSENSDVIRANLQKSRYF